MEFIVNLLSFLKKPSLLILTLSILIPFSIGFADTKSIKTIAIIPFETNSQDNISYITSGVWNMLYSRISWKDHVQVINKNKLSNSLDNQKTATENEMVLKIAQDTQAGYVMTGNITEFADAFSLDVKIYDIKSRSYLTFYDQTTKIDEVIQKMDIICAKINKKVFDRTTTTFEKLKKEEIVTEEELKRMHPEQMMPMNMNQEKKADPWWKFW